MCIVYMQERTLRYQNEMREKTIIMSAIYTVVLMRAFDSFFRQKFAFTFFVTATEI